MTDLLAIGTRKGLWLARSDDDRRTWSLDGPHLLAQEIAAVCIDTRPPAPRVLAGIQYGHWGPTVMWSDDLGGSWQETEHGAIRFPEDAGAALARGWRLAPASRGPPGGPRPASGSCAPTPRSVPTSSGPAASRTRCGAAPMAAAPSTS